MHVAVEQLVDKQDECDNHRAGVKSGIVCMTELYFLTLMK